ncbi:MAG: hypothetical protein ACFNX0_02005 [Treponema sp.]
MQKSSGKTDFVGWWRNQISRLRGFSGYPAHLTFPISFENGQIAIKLQSMFNVKETDFFDIEDESFDKVIEP